MIDRYFYENSFSGFLSQSNEEIFGILSSNNNFNLVLQQKDAWLEEIPIMKDLIKHFKSIDKSLKYRFYLEMKNILSIFKRKNYLKDIDWFYRIKASTILNHTYFLFKLLSKI